jgi:hypothetical protein
MLDSGHQARTGIVAAIILSASILGTPSASAQTGEVNAFSLVGKWSVSANTSDGATMTTELTLTPDMKFSGVSGVAGRPFWTFSGTWKVEGDEVVWRYENSSRPLPESAKVDADRIVSVDGTSLVLISKLNGKRYAYSRVK